jgi:hypothetical protein
MPGLDNRLIDGDEVVGPTHRPSFSPQEDSWYSFLLEVESTIAPQCGRSIDKSKDLILNRAHIKIDTEVEGNLRSTVYRPVCRYLNSKPSFSKKFRIKILHQLLVLVFHWHWRAVSAPFHCTVRDCPRRPSWRPIFRPDTVLTDHYKKQVPSWEASGCSACQEITRHV